MYEFSEKDVGKSVRILPENKKGIILQFSIEDKSYPVDVIIDRYTYRFTKHGKRYLEDKHIALELIPESLKQKEVEKGGVKFDSGKLPIDLVPPSLITSVAQVLDFGAKKYAPRNWENGMKWGRIYASIMRHLLAWFSGQDLDPETGLSHLAHAACNMAFLIEYKETFKDGDDRPRRKGMTDIYIPYFTTVTMDFGELEDYMDASNEERLIYERDMLVIQNFELENFRIQYDRT